MREPVSPSPSHAELGTTLLSFTNVSPLHRSRLSIISRPVPAKISRALTYIICEDELYCVELTAGGFAAGSPCPTSPERVVKLFTVIRGR